MYYLFRIKETTEKTDGRLKVGTSKVGIVYLDRIVYLDLYKINIQVLSRCLFILCQTVQLWGGSSSNRESRSNFDDFHGLLGPKSKTTHGKVESKGVSSQNVGHKSFKTSQMSSWEILDLNLHYRPGRSRSTAFSEETDDIYLYLVCFNLNTVHSRQRINKIHRSTL